MSQADVETLRSAYEAVNRRDWTAAFQDAHPDFEFFTGQAGEYRGPAAARRFMEGLTEPFEEVAFEPEDFFERDERIAVVVHFRARPRGSAAAVENRVGHLWTMRDGKAVRLEGFRKPEDALEAAGLQG